MAFGFVAAAAIALFRAPDLSVIQGYERIPGTGDEVRNLQRELESALETRSEKLVIGERELNDYIYRSLEGRQKGMLGGWALNFRRVYVDLEPGYCEVVIAREIFGRPLTMSLRCTIEEREKVRIKRLVGGRLGSIRAAPGFFALLRGSFFNLMDVYRPEIDAVFMMGAISFAKDRLVLDPRL